MKHWIYYIWSIGGAIEFFSHVRRSRHKDGPRRSKVSLLLQRKLNFAGTWPHLPIYTRFTLRYRSIFTTICTLISGGQQWSAPAKARAFSATSSLKSTRNSTWQEPMEYFTADCQKCSRREPGVSPLLKMEARLAGLTVYFKYRWFSTNIYDIVPQKIVPRSTSLLGIISWETISREGARITSARNRQFQVEATETQPPSLRELRAGQSRQRFPGNMLS